MDTSEGPHYVGFPVTVQIAVGGFEEAPEPECRIMSVPDELTANLIGVSPNISTSVRMFNGRQTISKVVIFRINYQVLADKPGRYVLGPFEVTQNGRSARADAITLRFSGVEEDPDMRVELTVPGKAVFPGQRVPVTVQWWYSGEIKSVRNLRIHSRLFDSFRFVDRPVDRRSTALPIQTMEGEVELAAEATRRSVNGREFIVLSAERTMIPDRPGKFQFEPVTATMQKVTSWRRSRGDIFDSFFGNNRVEPGSVKPVRAVGQPLTINVKPFPMEGRPESFAGAIGKGFNMEVKADRTVVRVGDPITLGISVRGDGNLENVSLPPLSADGGLDPAKFRLPEGEVSGVMQDGSKNFEVRVRVTDPTVGEIPALSYSWFDPDTESYQTARSKPIALRVDEATRVSDRDVFVANATSENENVESSADSRTSADTVSPQIGSSSTGYTLSGADLAIESDATRVLRDVSDSMGGAVTQGILYALGILAIAIAVIDRKRRDVDPEIVARRKKVRKLRARIDQARQQPRAQAAEAIAGALRGLIAQVPNSSRTQAQAVIADCETLVYAPGESTNSSIDGQLVQRALQVADEIIKDAE